MEVRKIRKAESDIGMRAGRKWRSPEAGESTTGMRAGRKWRSPECSPAEKELASSKS